MVLLLLLGAARAEAFDAAAAESVLSSYRSEEEISGFIASRPTSCLQTTQNTKLCVWRFGNHNQAWKPIAKAIATKDRINVICPLSTDGKERRGTCSAYPRRSDRYKYRRPKRGGRSQQARAKKEGVSRARAALDGVRDLSGMVALLGDIPRECYGDAGSERSCKWQLDARTLGHGTVTASIPLPLSKKTHLICSLDASGQLRSPCTAGIGF